MHLINIDHMKSTKQFCFIILLVLFASTALAQNAFEKDSLIQSLLDDHSATGTTGAVLLNSGDFKGANSLLSNEIATNSSNATAYFQRGVANWAMSDTLNACRDWSAVLALGDTEMFNLLESKCHGSMIIENDTIPSKKYKKMWGREDANQASKMVVEQMPEFPGGQEKLAEYIFANTSKKIKGARGTVFVNFLISPKGKILFPYIAHGVSKECDAEALRVIRAMPAWKPGKEKGKAVYVRSSIPVRF
jgi:hypothetical protein